MRWASWYILLVGAKKIPTALHCREVEVVSCEKCQISAQNHRDDVCNVEYDFANQQQL